MAMNAVEYAEQVLKLKLSPWQRSNIVRLQSKPVSLDDVFHNRGSLYGIRACYLVYERWKNRLTHDRIGVGI